MGWGSKDRRGYESRHMGRPQSTIPGTSDKLQDRGWSTLSEGDEQWGWSDTSQMRLKFFFVFKFYPESNRKSKFVRGSKMWHTSSSIFHLWNGGRSPGSTSRRWGHSSEAVAWVGRQLRWHLRGRRSHLWTGDGRLRCYLPGRFPGFCLNN